MGASVCNTRLHLYCGNRVDSSGGCIFDVPLAMALSVILLHHGFCYLYVSLSFRVSLSPSVPLFLVAFELIAICVYGVYSQDRLWMPRPEFNYLSYSYWFEFAALVLALVACKSILNAFNHDAMARFRYSFCC